MHQLPTKCQKTDRFFVLIWLPEKLEDQVRILKKMEDTDGFLLTVKLHLPWFPSCQQPMCAVHVWSGHRCDCCAAVLISLIGCTLLRRRQTASNGFSGHLSIHQERSDATGLSDYRALHQSAIDAEILPPLCRQPILLAALSLVWEIKPGSRMHENEQSNF